MILGICPEIFPLKSKEPRIFPQTIKDSLRACGFLVNLIFPLNFLCPLCDFASGCIEFSLLGFNEKLITGPLFFSFQPSCHYEKGLYRENLGKVGGE